MHRHSDSKITQMLLHSRSLSGKAICMHQHARSLPLPPSVKISTDNTSTTVQISEEANIVMLHTLSSSAFTQPLLCSKYYVSTPETGFGITESDHGGNACGERGRWIRLDQINCTNYSGPPAVKLKSNQTSFTSPEIVRDAR